MTTHGHKHTHEKQADQHSHHKIDWSALHKDWRAWLIIGIMLAAMAAYVLTLDESIQPGSAARSGIQASPAK